MKIVDGKIQFYPKPAARVATAPEKAIEAAPAQAEPEEPAPEGGEARRKRKKTASKKTKAETLAEIAKSYGSEAISK